ncbi:MAG TPA: hypothetical protein VF989_18230 [Polyangiaceae bacterium]
MITRVTPELVRDARRYAFRYGCESCAHYEIERSECSNGYPNAAHRERSLGERGTVVFCKLFELG